MLEAGTDALHQQALKYLARREYSRQELAVKLRQLAVNRAALEQELDLLQAKGWQSDRRFGEQLVYTRVQAGYGPQHIRQELLAKGLERSLIDELLQDQEYDWEALAWVAFTRHFAAELTRQQQQQVEQQQQTQAIRADKMQTLRNKQRYLNYLLRKGFNLEQLRQVQAYLASFK